MKKIISSILFLIFATFIVKAQNLDSFYITIKTNNNNYLSLVNKKAYTQVEAGGVKQSIDLALITTKVNGKQKLEWYNMNGKDEKIPTAIIGTTTLLNTINFDKEQFDKCITNQDLKRMTGYLTNNSFSHFASISDDVEKGITYPCFIIQLENGKRALLWLAAVDSNTFTASLKMQH